MTEQSDAPERDTSMGRVTVVVATLAIAAALVGFLIGINGDALRPTPWRNPFLEVTTSGIDAAESDNVIASVAYLDLPAAWKSPTERYRELAQPLLRPEIPPYGTTIVPDPRQKQQSLKKRSAARAYNGAPPVITHPVDNTNDAACYACHGQGLVMDGVRASVMPHPLLLNCTQCHVPPAPQKLQLVATNMPSVENDFEGVTAPTSGARAYPGAPPVIPHATHMRENCLACHGPAGMGWPGLETTHPWRQNCTQCHAPSAVLDQLADSDEPAFLPGLPIEQPGPPAP